jgi:flagellar biosynthesis anti-sigma factor FlgM
LRVSSTNPLMAIQKVKANEAATAKRKSETTTSDRVSFSDEAQRLREQARAEHISRIAESIADGSYSVDLDRLAEAFISRESR